MSQSPFLRPAVVIRPAEAGDHDAMWAVLEPVIRAGETYAIERTLLRDAALSYWTGPDREAFVAEVDGQIVGTYYLRANQAGGGAHVANCGYVTLAAASGQGVARAMCAHSLDAARARGFRAMQFNLVVGTNTRALRLWHSLGFETVGRLERAFAHPDLGDVDAFVLYRLL